MFGCSDLHADGSVFSDHAYVYAHIGMKKTFDSDGKPKVFAAVMNLSVLKVRNELIELFLGALID